ncbi:MAG: ABC transporter substrate-binding protein [Rhodospirillaceae bacterium]
MTALRRLAYGTPTDKSGIAVRIGVEQGFFRDIGIELEVRTIFGGPPLAAAYDSGEMSFGQIGSPPAVNAIAKGARFRIVGGGLRRKLHSYLGVRPEIAGFDDLRGARIGILSRGSCAEWFLRAMLRHRGLDPDRDVEIVELRDDFPNLLELVADGRADGGLIVEPLMAQGETLGVLRKLRAMYEEDYLPEAQWIVRVAREDFMRDEPDLLRALLAACRRSAHYAAANPEAWQDFTMRTYGVDRETAARAAAREFPHFHLDGGVSRAGLETVIELQKSLGAITSAGFTADDALDLRYLEAA